MRILVISNLYPYNANKVYGVFTARQFAMAARLGAEVTVLFTQVWIPGLLQQFGPFKNYDLNRAPVEYPGVKVIQVPCVRWTRGIGGLRWDGLMFYASGRKVAFQLHRENPFDIIYGKGVLPCGDGAVRLKKQLNIPVVAEGIGGDVNVAPDYSPAMYRHFLRTVQGLDGAVADGKGVADRLSGVMHKDIPTIHGLVDMESFKPVSDKNTLRRQLNIPEKSLVLLFVGNLKREKGLYELLEVMGQIRGRIPGAVLNICGRGSEHNGLKAKIAELGVGDIVRLAGAVDPGDMHRWMQAADVFVLPSYTEGMPNVVMEAMACGLPTISTTVGGLPDGIGDSEGAILVEPQAVQPLAEAMLRVSGDKSLQDKMSRAARQTAEQKFGLENNVKKTLVYLQDIISHHPKSRSR